MKTVALVSSDELHREQYGPALRSRFAGLSVRKKRVGRADAVVYDVAGDWDPEVDGRWLEQLDVPVVVLTAAEIPIPETATRRILRQPVEGRQIVAALSSLGVNVEHSENSNGGGEESISSSPV